MKLLTNNHSKPAYKPSDATTCSMPDRYFIAFVSITLPWVTHGAWEPAVSETFLFEQPDSPSAQDIIDTAMSDYPTATDVSITNFYSTTAEDFKAFMGDSSQWQEVTA